MLEEISSHKGTQSASASPTCTFYFKARYKDAGEALRRKQDKEREAAGLPPVQRVGARGTMASQRGQQRGGPSGRGGHQRGSAVPARGGRGGSNTSRTIHAGNDKNLYVHLLGHLKKKGLLPVVIFTFSKRRCEENAATLTNADLCTSLEKSEVHVTIEKALSRLKGESSQSTLVSSFSQDRSRVGPETATNQSNAGPPFSWNRSTSWRASAYCQRGTFFSL
jgi:superfamily II RNA helicase